MEEIKAPKKERKFLKAVGNIAKVLANELVMGIARKFIGKTIDKVGNKRQGLVIAFLLVAGISYASMDSIPYPITGNKQRLGWQTTGNGLVYRGRATDTITKPTSYADKNVKAYLILDSVSGSLYVFKQGSWAAISGAGGGLTMPFDSITFNTAKDGTVGVGEVEYNDTQGSLIQGLKGGLVTNVIGQQLHQQVNNRTGATLTKGTAVYLSGSQGNRITVAKALGVTDAFSANTFGIVAESISNNQSGYIITEGLITNINTSALVEDSAVYLSPTVAGGLTSTKPQAPQHTVYIGVCVKSNAGSGELFVKIRNGQELNELHDVRITSPVNKASLYYLSSQGIWRDTTPTLLVSDTASMLANYATKAYADTSGRFYARQDFTNVSSSTLTWTQSDTLVVGGTGVVQVYRNGQILLPTQYTIPTNASVIIGATAYKVGENYTVIFPRGGGGGGSGGSGSLTSISGGTGITVSPNPITTTGTVSADLSVLMELTDTTLLNLTSRFAAKLNPSDTISLSNRINTKGSGTVTSIATGYGLSGGTITTTGTLLLDSSAVFTRIRDSIVDVAIGNDTIKILKQEYAPTSTNVLTWTITPKFPIQLKAYILVFRNGQLLNNDQYNLTDTNKITIVSTSFKVGANYTVATVSGIGSIGTGVFPNPIYPEAGIAVSTGTTWTTSITNNSSNWNTAFSDRLKWDGGSTGLTASTGRASLGGTTIGQSMFTLSNPSSITFPRFNANNSVSSLTASEFRTAIGAGVGTVTSVTVGSGTPLSINNNTTVPEISMAAASGSVNGYLSSTDWTTFNGKQNALGNASASVNGILTSTDWTTFNSKQAALGFTPANSTITIATTAPLQGGGNLTANRTLSITQATTSADGFLTSTDWNTFNGKQNTLVSGTTIKTVNGTTLLGSGNLSVGTLVGTDTVSLSNRINLKVNISDTSIMLLPYLRKADTTSMLIPYFKDADTSLLNLTNRFATKLNISDTLSMLSKYLRKLDTITLSNRINLKLNISDTASMLTPYFRDNDTTQLNLTSRFAAKQNTLTNPVTGTGTTNTLPLFTGTSTLGNSVIQESSGNIGIGVAPIANLTFDVAKNILLKSGSTGIASVLFSETGTPSSTDVEFGGILRYNGSLDRMELVTRDNLGGSNVTNTGLTMDRITGNIGLLKPTTISSTLTVTGAITENGNNVLTNLDTASLSTRIDAKLNKTDTASLSNRINGKVSLTGDQTISGNKTFSGNTTSAGLTLTQTTSGTNKLLGLNSSGGAVGQITVGNGLKLLSDTLTVNERFYFDLGTVAGQADNVTGTYNFSYSGNALIVPSSLNGYCIDTVNIRAISCTDCPPAAGEKDYYMGVYKVSAGNPVTSTGATMQGSQIVCNEYDLKQENVNHVLTTGDVWWVYLNGSYFSDMEIIKASFIVKKTCN